jgi:hypothetical protein
LWSGPRHRRDGTLPAEKGGSGDAAAGGADRLFSPLLCSQRIKAAGTFNQLAIALPLRETSCSMFFPSSWNSGFSAAPGLLSIREFADGPSTFTRVPGMIQEFLLHRADVTHRKPKNTTYELNIAKKKLSHTFNLRPAIWRRPQGPWNEIIWRSSRLNTAGPQK